MRLACWGAGLPPMHGLIRWLDVNGPVMIDGMRVRPGDIIHADVNGALVVPRASRIRSTGRAWSCKRMNGNGWLDCKRLGTPSC